MSYPPPPRIIFVDALLTYNSGVTQVLYRLACNRQNESFEMIIASLGAPQQVMLESFGAVGVGVNHISDSRYMQSTFSLRQLSRRHCADLIVANSLRSYFIAKIATLMTGIPIVYWIHTINQIHVNRLKGLFFSLLSRHDALIYVSEAVRENNQPRNHRGQEVVIYNGVETIETNPDWQPYPSDKRAEFSIPDDAIVLGYTASFVYYKDHPTLVRAFDGLSKKFPNLYLILVGDGEDFELIRRQADQIMARDRILFLGNRIDARAILGLVDIYVHVATEEAFGLAVVEAMLAERPIIAARAFALPELIHDGKTGLLFEPGDTQDLERQVTQLLEDWAYAAQLAQAGAHEARQRFSPEPFVQQVTDFLNGIVTTRPLQISPRRKK